MACVSKMTAYTDNIEEQHYNIFLLKVMMKVFEKAEKIVEKDSMKKRSNDSFNTLFMQLINDVS